MVAAVGVSAVVLAGCAISHLLAPRLSLPERVASGYCIGLASVTFLLFMLSWAGVPLSPGLCIGVPVVLGAGACAVRHRAGKKGSPGPGTVTPALTPSGGIGAVEFLLLGGIVILVGIAAVQALYWPVRAFDAIHLYDHRAKLVYEQRGIALDEYHTRLFGIYVDYPLHVTLSHSVIYLLAGRSDINPKLIYVGYYAALLTVVYCRTRRAMTIRNALLATLVIASAPPIFKHTSWCTTTFPYMCYYSIGVIYLCEFMRGDDRGLLYIGALLVAFTSWIRPANELVVLGVAVVLGYDCARKRRWAPVCILLAAAGAVYAAWTTYGYTIHRYASLATFHFSGYDKLFVPGNVLYVMKNCIADHTLSVPYAGLIWYVFSLAIVRGFVTGRGQWEMPAIIMFTLGVLSVLFYSIGIRDDFADSWRYNAWNASSRLMPMLIPLAVYYSALVLLGDERYSGRISAPKAPRLPRAG